jgi:hypothetical protein
MLIGTACGSGFTSLTAVGVVVTIMHVKEMKRR